MRTKIHYSLARLSIELTLFSEFTEKRILMTEISRWIRDFRLLDDSVDSTWKRLTHRAVLIIKILLSCNTDCYSEELRKVSSDKPAMARETAAEAAFPGASPVVTPINGIVIKFFLPVEKSIKWQTAQIDREKEI